MISTDKLTTRHQFLNVMEYKPVDAIPNYEAGVWGQTIDRWAAEGLDLTKMSWNWFWGEDYFHLTPREFIRVNYNMMPPFEYKVLEQTDKYEIIRDDRGMVRKTLKAGYANGTRASMDQFLSFPVKNRASFYELKKRYTASLSERYPKNWKTELLPGWKSRDHVLILGENCSTGGFYWLAREWMGTEGVSYGWYDEPELMHEMMEFIADYTIEVSRPVLAETDVDYVMLSEDMSMKGGPLVGPETYKKFIYPHLRRLVDFFKSNGVRYIFVDTDGDPDKLVPLLMDAGVDGLWPMERAAGADPVEYRKKYGKALRLTGGVDKMRVAQGPAETDKLLTELYPLVEEGGFIPTIDHTVPPDVSLADFEYYMKRKIDLLTGKF